MRSVRLVSLVHRAVAAILYEVEPIDEPARIVVQSELVANEPQPGARLARPAGRRGAARSARARVHRRRDDLRVTLVHRTRASGLLVGAAMDHVVEAPDGGTIETEIEDDLGRVTVVDDLEPGSKLRIVKFLAYGWSAARSLPAVRDQVEAALVEARHTGWDGLRRRAARDARRLLAARRRRARRRRRDPAGGPLRPLPRAPGRRPRRAPGDPGQGAHRARATTVTRSGTPRRSCCRCSPTRCRRRRPRRCAGATRSCRWRASAPARWTSSGATFPWRTIAGEECSAYWPAGTAAFHVSADVADAVIRYVQVTEDADFERDVGLELLVETARLWRSLGHHDPFDGFRIDGVTGPDEYSAIADNNVYTNLMAQRNLRAAAQIAERHPERARGARRGRGGGRRLARGRGRDGGPLRRGPGRARAVGGLHPPPGVGLRARPATATRCCCTSPTSSSTAGRSSSSRTSCWPCTCAATRSRTRRRCATSTTTSAAPCATRRCRPAPRPCWPPRSATSSWPTTTSPRPRWSTSTTSTTTPATGCTSRRSPGPGSPAWRGSAACATTTATLTFAPRLPEDLSRLAFRLCFRGRRVVVTVEHESATYELFSGEPVELAHHGEAFTLAQGTPATLPVPPAPDREQPPQPPGRGPRPRQGNARG